MSVISRLCLVDWRTSALRSRIFSTSVKVPTMWNCTSMHTPIRVYNLSSKYLLAPVYISSSNVRYMSDSKNPHDKTNPDPWTSNRNEQEKMFEEKHQYSRFEQMLQVISEKTSNLQSFGKHISDRTSVLNTRIKSEAHTLSHSVYDGQKKPEDWNDILNRWYNKYQDFIGIAELKRAQDKVTELSESLLETQSRRRLLQAELEELQERLTVNHQRITKTELYSEEHYHLFDEARDLNKRLKDTRADFDSCEHLERETFTQLSAAIRDCHERERTQAEQSKYWSIIVSIVSAALASVITSVNSWVRFRDIKIHVTNHNQQLLDGYEKMHFEVVEVLNNAIKNSSLPSTNINKETEDPDIHCTKLQSTVEESIIDTQPTETEKGTCLEKSSVDMQPVEIEKDTSIERTIVDVLSVPTEDTLDEKTLNKQTVEIIKSPSAEELKEAVSSYMETSSIRLVEDDIDLLNKRFSDILKEQVSSILANETKVMQEIIQPNLDAIFANLSLILEGNKMLVDTISEGTDRDIYDSDFSNLRNIDITPPVLLDGDSEQVESKSTGGYKRRHIASALVVGASLGYLATGFFLGAIDGSAGG